MPRVSAEAHLAGYRRLCENISQRLSARWIPGVVHTQVQYLRCLDRMIRPGAGSVSVWLETEYTGGRGGARCPRRLI